MGVIYKHQSAPISTAKDLFGLQSGSAPFLKGMEATRQWLENLGFLIDQRQTEHWVLTHSAPLPELHFYNAQELELFARHRAHHYANRSLKEIRP